MKLTRMWLDEHLNMRSYFVTVYDHIEEINQQTGNQLFQNWMTCLFLVKKLSFKYNIWTSWFIKKIKNNAHYHNVLKFEELETVLTVKKTQMNFNSVIEKANIMWAFKKRFKQQENCNNQSSKFTNDNDQSNSQNNQNSEQNQHSAVSHDRDYERFNWFLNNWFNNISSTINSDKQSNQNTEKFMMTRILSTELEESIEFVKILNWTAQSINKSIEWLADTDVICHIINLSDYFVNLTFCSHHVSVVNANSC